jgi:N-acetylglutamate synthase-like GNAT family acetyltransferase
MPPGGLIVRRAGPADARPLAALARLANSASPPFESVDAVARFLADPRNFQIVAEEENRLVSSMTMTYRPWNDSCELGRELTRPDCRRRGLGALLMRRAVDAVCDAALGEVFIASLRARSLVDLCAALDPPMIVAGHDSGRLVASGSRGAHLIVLSIPTHARFVHVTPPLAESARVAFIRECVYRPLRLCFAPGDYPPESLVGATSDWSLDWGDLVVDYDPGSPNRALAIVGVRARRVLPAHFSRDLDRVLRALPDVEHIIVTVLADKTDFLRQLFVLGFELAAYLPAWYKAGVFRYDCVQLVLRRSGAPRASRDRREPLSGLQRENASDSRSLPSGPRSTCTEDPDMSPLTIAGLPVLAIVEDFHAGATDTARRRAQDLTPTSERQTPGPERAGGETTGARSRFSSFGIERGRHGRTGRRTTSATTPRPRALRVDRA